MASRRPVRADAQASSRERMLAGAADMLSRRGANATSIREVAKHAQAPLGSTYHYFRRVSSNWSSRACGTRATS